MNLYSSNESALLFLYFERIILNDTAHMNPYNSDESVQLYSMCTENVPGMKIA